MTSVAYRGRITSDSEVMVQDGVPERYPEVRFWSSKPVADRLTSRVAEERPSSPVDLNKARIRSVAEAVLALSASPGGFTASQLGEHVRRLSEQAESEYGPRRAAYDLKKLRGKQILSRIGNTARYEPIPQRLRAMAAMIVLRDKAIKPLLAAAQQVRRSRQARNPTKLDTHYRTLRTAMQGVFQELGVAA